MKLIVLLFAAFSVACAAQADEPRLPPRVTPYPLVPGDAANAHFAVKVNGTPVEACTTAMNVGYAHFAFDGTVRIEITASEPVETSDLSPHRLGIEAVVQGRTLTFELSRPAKLHLQVNKLPRFFLFADAPEAALPEHGVHEITSFGVTSSPDKVQTSAIQRAIDEVATRKGTLLVPPGIYRTGELRMRSGLTLHVAAGAILKGTGNMADHPVGEFDTQLLNFVDCEQVRVTGRGVIDAQGRALRLSGKNASATRSKLIRSVRARKIVVEDVILRDSGTWDVHLIESEDLRFSGVKLISNTKHDDPAFPWETNTDGFDPDNSSRVLIERCWVSTNDDSIAVKLRYGTRRDVGDIVFRDNVCWSVKSALKIGSEVYEKKLTNVVFENNDVIRADRGIVVYAYDGGTVENVRWRGNHFEFIGGDLKRMHLEIKLNQGEGKGQLRGLLLQNETFEREAENRSKLQGLDADHPLDGVVFDNLVIAGQKRLDANSARIEVSRHVRGVSFK